MSAPEQRSLFGEILDWMLVPLLLLWPMSLGLTGVVAQEIANRPYDRDLVESTKLIGSQLSFEPGIGGVVPHLRMSTQSIIEMLRSDDTDQIYFQVLGPSGSLIAGDAELPVPDSGAAASGEPQVRDDFVREEAVRVATLWLPLPADAQGGTVTVQLAETLGKRKRLSAEIIKGVILPQFVILPIAVLLVWLALARGIRPLDAMQQRIRERPAGDLSPIDARAAPQELLPLVHAINDLLLRLDRSMSAQKHFLADAAHQLKTPLAGLQMQAEIAGREIDAGQRDPQALKTALHQIALSSQRAAHAVNQLLAMARAEDREQALRQEHADLAEITQQAVFELLPKAMDKRIDLGYEGEQPGQAAGLWGHPVLLGELVRNLVDNALQYTPAGGTVTARVQADPEGQALVLQVEDSGPGVPEAERDKIFQPFYRALGTGVDGTGLGLAIVLEIAQQHGAQVTVSDARATDAAAPAAPAADGAGPGALFTVRFARGPLPAGSPPAWAAA